MLAEAESLWRGRPLADLEFEPFARIEVDRLEEMRLVAAEERIDSELALGHHSRLVAELEAQVAAHPLREHLRGQLMLALYRCGRQADALEAYRTGRAVMSEQLALEPGPALKQLERSILLQDPGLDRTQGETESRPVATRAPPADLPLPDPAGGLAPAPVGTGRRLRASLVVLTLVVLGIAVAVAAVAGSGGGRALRAAPNSTGVIDSRAETLSTVIDTAGRPGAIAAGAGAVWETDTADGLLLELDRSRRIVERIPVGRDPTGVAVGGGRGVGRQSAPADGFRDQPPRVPVRRVVSCRQWRHRRRVWRWLAVGCQRHRRHDLSYRPGNREHRDDPSERPTRWHRGRP